MSLLVIVESEAKAKAVADQAGELETETLLLRSAPMTISHTSHAAAAHDETRFQFAPTPTQRDFARTLLLNLHRDICLALDSDTRGEYWSWMLHSFLMAATKGQKGIRRIHVSSYVGQQLAESLQADQPVQERVAIALHIQSLFNHCLRGHLQRLIGAASGPGGLALHFQVLTVLFLLAEKRGGVVSLATPAKQQIMVRLSPPAGRGFSVKLQEAYGIIDDGCCKDESEARAALALCEGQPFVVKSVTSTDFTIESPPPYTLPELLHDGHTLLGMGPAAVFYALQKFYGGIAIRGKYSGLVSSPFAILPFQWGHTLDRIRQEVEAVYGRDQLVAREPVGHVVLPLRPEITGADLEAVLSGHEQQLYELIRCRALASQMQNASGRNLTVHCEAGSCRFQGHGPQLGGKGFLAAFAHGYDPELSQDCPLQQLTKGLQIHEASFKVEALAASAESCHTYASLFADLADFAVSAEANVVLMLQEMMDKDYVALDTDGFFHLRENGEKVIAILDRAFPAMKGVNLSAYFAQTVSEALSGRKSLDAALKQFDQNFIMHGVPLIKSPVPKAVAIRERRSKNIIKSPELETGRPLPQEGEPLQADDRQGPVEASEEPQAEISVLPASETSLPRDQESSPPQPESPPEETPEVAAAPGAASLPAEEAVEVTPEAAGKLVPLSQEAAPATEEKPALIAAAGQQNAQEEGQSPAVEEEPGEVAGFPSAETVAAEQLPFDAPPQKECPVCGRPLLLKSDRFGRFWSCSGFPACRHSESFAPEQQEMALACPLCHHETLLVKLTSSGKKLYVCPAAGCEFMAWSRPHAVQCPHCGSPFLVEKKTASGGMVLLCPRAGCGYYQPLTGPAASAAGGGEAAPVKKVLVRRRAGSGKTRKVLVRLKKG